MKRLKRLWILLAIAFVLWAGSANEWRTIHWVIEKKIAAHKEILEEDVNWLQLYEREWISKIGKTIWSDTIAEAIVVWCKNHSTDRQACMRHVFGVANAESSLFKNVSSKNNAFWIMHKKCWVSTSEWYVCRYVPKSYTSVEESVIDFLKLYEKNNWSSRTYWNAWLAWNYCSWACPNWVQNFTDGMIKLDLSLL